MFDHVMKKIIFIFVLLGMFGTVICLGCPVATAWSQTGNPEQFASQSGQPAQSDSFTGGLLGAVLLGEPFEGITIPDVLALLGLALIGYRLFRRSRDDSDQSGTGGSMMDDDAAPGPGMDSEAYRRAKQYWDYMNGKTDPKQSQNDTSPPAAPDAANGSAAGALKGRFDTDDFLKGAKLVYGRIHDGVKKNDYDDLDAFTTPDMLERIRSKPGTLAKNGMIMFVDAELLDVTDIAGETRATVRFKALVQYADKGKSEDVSEVWHFRRKSDDPKDTWRLQDTEHFQ